jgi:hypothetical protein
MIPTQREKAIAVANRLGCTVTVTGQVPLQVTVTAPAGKQFALNRGDVLTITHYDAPEGWRVLRGHLEKGLINA